MLRWAFVLQFKQNVDKPATLHEVAGFTVLARRALGSLRFLQADFQIRRKGKVIKYENNFHR
jgi:hypothetical protein